MFCVLLLFSWIGYHCNLRAASRTTGECLLSASVLYSPRVCRTLGFVKCMAPSSGDCFKGVSRRCQDGWAVDCLLGARRNVKITVTWSKCERASCPFDITSSCSEFLSIALTWLCWLRCTFQAEWASSFRMWICPTEEMEFQLHRRTCALFSCSRCHRACNVWACKTQLSRRNIRRLKFSIGLCKWMSDFK